MNKVSLLFAALLLFVSPAGHAQTPVRPQVVSTTPKLFYFSPQGAVEKVRQVVVRFSEPMVNFGDPRAPEPFVVDCPEKGQARWVDATTWAYDFEQDLPAGIACKFKTSSPLKSLSGKQVAADDQYLFTTGGPKVVFTRPFVGDLNLWEKQAWLLAVNAPVDTRSIAEHARCEVSGETRNVVLLDDNARNKLAEQYSVRNQTPATVKEFVALKCEGDLPVSAKIALVWSKGIRSASGVSNVLDQTLNYSVRGPLSLDYNCQWKKNLDCPFNSLINLNFSAPVARNKLEAITLTFPDGTVISPKPIAIQGDFFAGIGFEPPFPPLAKVIAHIPGDIRDDSGRLLGDGSDQTREIPIADMPTEIAFSTRAYDVGVLERSLGGIAPITLQNIKSDLPLKILKVAGSDAEIVKWLGRFGQSYTYDGAKKPVLTADIDGVETRTLRQLHSEKSREIQGIELISPGLYLLETSSNELPDTKPGETRYVRSIALVTNLALHFRRSQEGALVWVTTLDQGKPLAGTEIRVSTCDAKQVWQGVSDVEGLARIPADAFPKNPPYCSNSPGGFLVTARHVDDLGMTYSHWREGIDHGRFGYASLNPTPTVHTVFDRTLFRAGETVSMKHSLRLPNSNGLSIVDEALTVAVVHLASRQRTELLSNYRAGTGTTTSEWKIPADARLGAYQVVVSPTRRDFSSVDVSPAEFRVEEFRLPTMKAELSHPEQALIAPKTVPMDLKLSYLAGGGVEQRVRLKAAVRVASVRFSGYEDFTFNALGSINESYPRYGSPAVPYHTIVENREVALDANGQGSAEIDNTPAIERPTDLLVEMEFADGNGETQTTSTSLRLWPTDVLLGIKGAYWASAQTPLSFQVVALGTDGKALPGVALAVDGQLKKTSYQQIRTDNGLFRYETKDSTAELPKLCSGTTDERGVLRCSVPLAEGGQLTLLASARDSADRKATGTHSIQVFAGETWRSRPPQTKLEVLPEKRRYADGETAKVQVRVPVAPANALITVEREGIIETWIRHFEKPVETIEIPVKGRYAPNMFISVAAVSGRRETGDEPSPVGAIDLGKPRFDLGIAEIEIPPDAFKLDVRVNATSSSYKTRDKARVSIEVTRADGSALPAGAEVALVAVDEALLQLAPNRSWDILSGMLKRRGYGVAHAGSVGKLVAKQVLGKQNGIGGPSPLSISKPSAAKMVSDHEESESATPIRQLFDTLLLWQQRVVLDANGRASVDVPLNDSLSEFRIVAIAQAGQDLFGSGDTRIHTSKPLQILAGLPPLMREGDAFMAQATLRNTSEQAMSGEFIARPVRIHAAGSTVLQEHRMPFSLVAGESKTLTWPVTIPVNTERLDWLFDARANDGAADALNTTQKIVQAVPVTVQQATLAQLNRNYSLPVQRPSDAVPGVGQLNVSITPKLGESMSGMRQYMRDYPHTCLEQQVSTAIAIRNQQAWLRLAAKLGNYLDRDGLAKYWPGMDRGSEILTAYVLAITHQAGWNLPEPAKSQMLAALNKIAEGKSQGNDLFRRDDGTAHRLIVLEALARYGQLRPEMLKNVQIEPNRWPTSAVLDWLSILVKQKNLPEQKRQLEEAATVLRARMDMHGSTLNFSNERDDYWWWYMLSPDQNAVRAVLTAQQLEGWQQDLPRMVRGALLKQRSGHWQTTTANAWGALAMEAFSERFEREPVAGVTEAKLSSSTKKIDWEQKRSGELLSFDWPPSASTLNIAQKGSGRPWIMVQSRAAVPLKTPFFSGYRIGKTIEMLQRKRAGVLSVGDIARVTLTVDAQSDMNWVALSDPVPAGATILSRGLARDSKLASSDEKRQGWVWPSHEEKGFEAFRAYYRYVPKGKFSVEYTIRFNNEGAFWLPQTRVEAMYAPEMFGEYPNQKITVGHR